MIDREHLRNAIVAQLSHDLEVVIRAAQMARDEATHEESRAEGKYDTRAQEAAYLAEGQARAAAELQKSIAAYRELSFPTGTSRLAVGHVAELGDGCLPTYYFLGPAAGGLEVALGAATVLVVTPASPLGRQLLGAHVGAVVSLPGRPVRSLTLAAIT